MSRFTIKIDNILGGISPAQYIAGANQYDSAIGIDPDMPLTDSSVKTSGLIRPTAMSKFSSTAVSGVPLWLLTNPKNSNVYSYNSDGEVISYSSSLGSETVVGTPTSGAGNGAEYYDNYLYFATPTDISRYGPLNGSPSLANTYWSSTLGKTALTNTTYPSINGVTLPNHPMKYHTGRNRLYFGDVVSGKGVIHYIATTKTTVEGDTNNGSTYNALDLRYGYYPTCIEVVDTDLVIGSIQGTNTTIDQAKATISFWDTTSTTPTKIIEKELPDPYITAMKNVNGVLIVFTGNAQGGCRVLRFIGGYSFQEVAYFEECYPPLPGAVDHILNRVVFGGMTTYPEASASVYAIGSKNAKLSINSPIHNILKATSSGSNGWVTALKYILHGNNKIRYPIIGWKDDSGYGLDKISTTYGVNVWRSQTFRIGQPFTIDGIRIPMTASIGSNMTITPTLYIDDLTTSSALSTINNTNYPNSEKNATQKITGASGKHNFLLELRWTGSALCMPSLPITITGETLSDSIK